MYSWFRQTLKPKKKTEGEKTQKIYKDKSVQRTLVVGRREPKVRYLPWHKIKIYYYYYDVLFHYFAYVHFVELRDICMSSAEKLMANRRKRDYLASGEKV